jgi:hypothetical protein
VTAPPAPPRHGAGSADAITGRDRERVLAQHRLVIALGPGRTSRLAVSAAADLADRSPDGAGTVGLGPVTGPA